jgi:signal transduction histidine kinase
MRYLLRGSLRVKLTAVFGLLFFAAASAVLAGTLILVGNAMEWTVNQLDPANYVDPNGFTYLDRTGVEATKQTIMSSMQNNLLVKGGLTVLVVGALATYAGWVVSGRVLRPLNQITETARGVASRTIHRRIALDLPPGEVKSLADSFDSMLDRLDQAFAGQSRFISNAAHELKTPLVVNRTLVEVAMMRRDSPPEIQQLGENLLSVNARHERLIDALLTLARAEESIGERLPVDLADLVTVVVGRAREQAEAHGVRIGVSLSGALTSGDPVLLEQVVTNLVDNAIRYNVDGGWVEIRTGRSVAGAQVEVANTGAVISPHEVPLLFEPFRRLKDRVGSAAGSGLGLSIVRAVARSHGGDAVAFPRDGGGLVVRVALPASPHRASAGYRSTTAATGIRATTRIPNPSAVTVSPTDT